jgi:membrane protease YdiL (CAAX protease family)
MEPMKISDKQYTIPFSALLPYFLITFGVAWSIVGLYVFAPKQITALLGELSANHPAFILAVYSPAFASIAIVLYWGGLGGLKKFASRLLLWRCPPVWCAFIIFGIPLIYVAGSLVKGNILVAPLAFDGVGQLLGAMAFMLVLGPVEEFGWRGVALPILQRKFAPIWAAIVLGFIWGVWHLPAFFLSGTPQSAWGFMPFLVGAICVSVILTPLFNASGGSILLSALYHFQLNNPLWPDAQPYDTYFFVTAAVIVVWLNRKSMFSRNGAVTVVIPSEEDSSEERVNSIN